MRQFIKNKDICFHEEDFNKLIYGRSQKYKSLDLDFDTNVLPYLLSERLKKIIHLASFDVDAKFDWNTAGYLVEVLSEMVMFNKEPLDEENNDLFNIADIKEELGFLGADLKHIDTTGTTLAEMADGIKEYEDNIVSILNFLHRVDGYIRIKPNYPQSLYDLIYEAFTCLFVLCMQHPDQAAKHIKITPNKVIATEEDAYKIKEYIRYDNGILVFEDIEFKTINDVNLLKDILFMTSEDYIRAICFVRCHFNSSEISFSANPRRLYFIECVVEKQISLYDIDKKVEFDTCLIKGNIKSQNFDDLWIHHSSFELGSSLTLKNNYSDNNLIIMEDTIIKGKLEIDAKDIKLKWNNISFFAPFKTKGSTVHSLSEISNIAFPSNLSPDIMASKKEFNKVLIQSRLEDMATKLGLVSTEDTSFTDYDAYKVAYETGFLKSEYAAYFLGKSVSFLNQKRKKDKEMITRDSIPFTGVGKNIQYPVDALQAYKAKDWDKLKELRQKYKNKED